MTKNTLADYTIQGEIKVYQERLVELQDIFPAKTFTESDFAYLNRLEEAFDAVVDNSPRARAVYVSVRNHDVYAEEEAIDAKRQENAKYIQDKIDTVVSVANAVKQSVLFTVSLTRATFSTAFAVAGTCKHLYDAMLEHAYAAKPLIEADPETNLDNKVIKMKTLEPEIIESETEDSTIDLPIAKNVHFRDPIATYYEHPDNAMVSHTDEEPEPDKNKDLDFNLLSGLLMAGGSALCVTALIIMTAKITIPLFAAGLVLMGIGLFSKQDSNAHEEKMSLDNTLHTGQTHECSKNTI